jgi:uncharacterized protein (TIGR02145 family)
VPSDTEWSQLQNFLGDESNAGVALKSSSSDSPPWNGSNSSGFSGLPGGIAGDGLYHLAGAIGIWWSSTLNDYTAWSRLLGYNSDGFGRENHILPGGFSVRCILNSEPNICFDPDADGVCAQDEISGCMDTTANNFNPAATQENGLCEYPGPTQCGGLSTVTFDGHTYALVGIGTQCWFAENLRSDNYRNGDPIPGNLDDTQWTSTTEGAQTVYGEGNSTVYDGSSDEAANLESFGRLYNWFAVNDSRGLCPTGFHVPSDGDWIVLENSLGGSQLAGASLKASEPAWDGNDYSGFTAHPGGFRLENGSHYAQGFRGGWWSSDTSEVFAMYRNLTTGSAFVITYENYHNGGFSVRCVRD